MRGSALVALLPAAAALEGACQARNDTSIMGHDILAEAEHLLLPDPAACCAACQANSSCQYFTWYRRMAHEGSRCYLKSSAAGIKAAASRGGGVVTGQGKGPWPPPNLPPPASPPPPLPFDTAVTVDLTAAPQPFEHYWKKSFGSGHASLTLRPDWQAHLKRAVEDLGLSGVRHHGLLDDDMGVVVSPGVYNFSKVIESWKYQRSLGVTPIVETSFMPAVLAGCSWTDPAKPGSAPVNPGKKTCTHTGMKYKGIQELPTQWEDWFDVVKALAQAAVDTFGIEEVRGWSFECCKKTRPLSRSILQTPVSQQHARFFQGTSCGGCPSPAAT